MVEVTQPGRGPSQGRRIALVLLGTAALVVLSWGSVALGTPTVITPHSAVISVPYQIAGPVVAFSIIPAVFFLWNLGAMRGRRRLPRRSMALFTVVAVSSLTLLLMDWQRGAQEQGMLHMMGILAENAFFIGFLVLRASRSRRERSFQNTYVFHLALFAWIAWCAFPHIGSAPLAN